MDLQTVKDLAQIVYYVALSIAGPIALLEFLKARKADRLANEYKVYDELDNRFFEYQKLALEYYDLDILDVPNNDPSLAFDKKRKQEMVAYAILFSLFERAYLMFNYQGEEFQKRQWLGWQQFLNDFLRRENFRTAWLLSKETYDTEFQAFMDKKIEALVPRNVAQVPVGVVAAPAVVPVVPAVAVPVAAIAPVATVADAPAALPAVEPAPIPPAGR